MSAPSPIVLTMPRTNPQCVATWHGTENAYSDGGCRCPEAREARRLHNKRRREGRHAPRHVNAVGTARRLQALVAIGWTWQALGMAVRRSPRTVQQMAVMRRPEVHVVTAGWVRDLYDRLSNTPAGSAKALTVARRHGWVPPMAWDDDTIDDPDAQPVLGDVDDRTVVDPVAIERALAGERVRLTRLERHHAIHAGLARGVPRPDLSRTLRIAWSEITRLENTPLPDTHQGTTNQQQKERAA